LTAVRANAHMACVTIARITGMTPYSAEVAAGAVP
jgi:hypothetical protein